MAITDANHRVLCFETLPMNSSSTVGLRRKIPLPRMARLTCFSTSPCIRNRPPKAVPQSETARPPAFPPACYASRQERTMKDLAGKVAVITGAGSGFGREFAHIGARERMKVVLADVQDDALDAAVGEVRAGGAEALGVRADVAKAEDVQELAQRATAKF